ncbi:MAG: hypothetical protein WBH09_00315 [Rugosibacter sp.]
MDIRDYYKEHYFLEATRKGELTNALSLPLGILSLLIGGLTVVAKEIHLPLNNVSVLLLALIAAAAIFILRAVYFLIRSYYNYEYGHVPTPLEIKTYKEGLIAYYVSLGDSTEDAIKKADSEALQHIDSEYAAHADRNAKNNNRKSSFIHNANSSIIGAIIFTFAVGSTHIVTSIRTASGAQKVEIVNLKEITMAEPTNNAPPKAPEVPAPTTAKPVPPPGQILKEHVDPKTKK